MILNYCISAYKNGETPPTSLDIAKELGIPLLTVQQIIDILQDADILVEVSTRNSSRIGFQPSRDANLYTILDVCEGIEGQMSWSVAVEDSPELKKIGSLLDELESVVAKSKTNFTLNQMNEMINRGANHNV